MATSTKTPVAKVAGKAGKRAPVPVVAKPVPKAVPTALTKAVKPAPAPVIKTIAAPVVEPVAAAVETVETPVAAIEAVAEKTADVARATTETLTKTITETKAAPVIASAATKEASTMVEQFKTAAQTAFTQGSEKARETLEKTVKSFEEAGEFAKGNVEALVASGKAATPGAETIAQSAADFSKKSFEASSAHMQTLVATRNPADAMKLQSDFAKSQFDGLVAEMSKSTEMMMKLMGDVFEPLSSRVALASEKAKTLVATAR